MQRRAVQNQHPILKISYDIGTFHYQKGKNRFKFFGYGDDGRGRKLNTHSYSQKISSRNSKLGREGHRTNNNQSK